MKNLLLLLLTTFALNSCNNDDNKPSTPKTELEKLPPATQTGANTAGCLINGKAFLPKGYYPSGNLSCNYIDGKDFSLRISERIMEGPSDNIRSVFIISENQNLHDNVAVTFLLNNRELNSKYGTYIINAAAPPNTDYYSTNSIVTGEFVITNHNFNQAIISGTFWFDAINSNGEKVEVREGRFDMHY
jgi:hypothetical protein